MPAKRPLLAAGFVLLFVLHQDFWWKADPTLVLGIMPVSLAYHVAWTFAVAALWWLVTKHAWPTGDESPSPAKAAPPPDVPAR